MNMALANESTDPHIQACNHIYGVFPSSSSSDLHLQSQFGFFDHLPFHEAEMDVLGEGSSFTGKDKLSSSFNNFPMVYNHNSSPTSSPCSENSGGGRYGFQGTEYLSTDVRPSLNIKLSYENCMHPNGSLLSFDKAKMPIPQNGFNSFGLLENFNPQQSDGNFSVFTSKKIVKEKQGGDLLAGWITCDATSDDVEEIAVEGSGNHKRPQTGESNTKSQKKQCTTATKKKKAVNLSPSEDPQSVAAKNRRERISERLKILQELVPNGSKVDLVTMLEKAISYVKFLQLQVKVLASDEFWPDQGGKAPELSQVKDAIDAILSSHQINKCSSSR